MNKSIEVAVNAAKEISKEYESYNEKINKINNEVVDHYERDILDVGVRYDGMKYIHFTDLQSLESATGLTADIQDREDDTFPFEATVMLGDIECFSIHENDPRQEDK